MIVNTDGTFSYESHRRAGPASHSRGHYAQRHVQGYTVTDELNQSATATVTITVSGIDNDLPFLEITDPTAIKANIPITIDLRDYIADWETADADLIFTLKDNPTNGTATQGQRLRSYFYAHD